LDSALVELADKGWGGLRTREVADRAGVNKALVHYHFGSMDNLRLEAVASLMTGVVNEAASVLIEAPTLAEGIRSFGETLDRFSSEDPGSVVLMEAMLHAPRDERLEAMLLRALEFYEEALRQRIDSDAGSDRFPVGVDSAGLATALTALFDGLVLHAYMRPGVDFRPAADSVADLFDFHAPKPAIRERKHER
jgi:AcrR family transcriptional regulator